MRAQHSHVSIWLTNEAGLPIDCGPLSSSCDQAQFARHKYAGACCAADAALTSASRLSNCQFGPFAPLDANELRFCEMAGEEVRCFSQSSVVRVSLPFQYRRKLFFSWLFFCFWMILFTSIKPTQLLKLFQSVALIGAFYLLIKMSNETKF